MPSRVRIIGKDVTLTPNAATKSFEFPEDIKTFEVDRNFYIDAEQGGL
jgi:hypothetical protein